MGLGSNKKLKHSYYGTGRFTPVYDDLVQSEAYRCLTKATRLILIDMMRTYWRASSFGRMNLSGGFTYSYATCREEISEKRFYEARQRLVDAGFFEFDPMIQPSDPQASKRYLPSSAWTKYKPTKDQRIHLAESNKAKKVRIAGKRQGLANYRLEAQGTKRNPQD